jgi:tryptophan synthase alpha chain
MNRIDELFARKRRNVLSIYVTAGFPRLGDTTVIIESLQEHGADMIEIGMPFSDPLADGPVIQHSSQVAIQNGMNPEVLFLQLKDLRKSIHIPLILMGYLNPLLQYGLEDFLANCRKVGIDGLIVPDLPVDIYENSYRPLFQKYGIYFSMLITPQTEPERIRRIADLSDGFLYMVADSATTGARGSIGENQLVYFEKINSMELTIPRLIGFGISSRETFRTACEFSNGAIIGSAFIKSLEKNIPVDRSIREFMAEILQAGD